MWKWELNKDVDFINLAKNKPLLNMSLWIKAKLAKSITNNITKVSATLLLYNC